MLQVPQAMVMSWAVTATAAMLLVNIPISVGMWYGGEAARIFFRQVHLPHSFACTALRKWVLSVQHLHQMLKSALIG